MKINVYHNTAVDSLGRPLGMIEGYSAGDPLALVAQVDVPDSLVATDEAHAEDMFHLFNVGDDPEYGKPSPIAQEYRFRGNRSLSTGDVVQVDGRAYAVASFGFKPIEAALTTVQGHRRYGTYSID